MRATVTHKPATAGQPIRVAVVGDSRTCAQESLYPLLLDEYLDSSRIEVTPECRSGETNGGLLGLDEIYGVRERRLDEIVERGYDEVILDVGVNDMASGRTAEDMERKLVEICGELASSGVSRIIMLEATPWRGFKKWTDAKGMETLSFNRMLADLSTRLTEEYARRRLPTEVELVRLYDAMENPCEPGELEFPTLYPDMIDWLHPSIEGLEVMAEQIVEQAFLAFANERFRSIDRELESIFRTIRYERSAESQ
ncbi:MAG: SGNH/GDSL hydrolase family protein [Proteobacteria bacterium]|nr:SGNH/GDSL hydrolase family protein [Pseudomonadota bacterium]